MSQRGRRVSCAAASGLLAWTFAAALDFPVWTPPTSMYRAHREKVLAKLPANSIAILRSAPQRTFSNDTEYPYRQDSDFHYVTGFDEPDSVAVLRPNASDGKRYLLYVRAHDPRREAYDGARPATSPASRRSTSRMGETAPGRRRCARSWIPCVPATPALRRPWTRES